MIGTQREDILQTLAYYRQEGVTHEEPPKIYSHNQLPDIPFIIPNQDQQIVRVQVLDDLSFRVSAPFALTDLVLQLNKGFADRKKGALFELDNASVFQTYLLAHRIIDGLIGYQHWEGLLLEHTEWFGEGRKPIPTIAPSPLQSEDETAN